MKEIFIGNNQNDFAAVGKALSRPLKNAEYAIWHLVSLMHAGCFARRSRDGAARQGSPLTGTGHAVRQH